MGLNVKLDVGLYRLDQQVACQRYRQIILDAISNFKSAVASVRNFVASIFTPRTLALNYNV